MAALGGIALIEDFLQFVGVFVSFSIAYVAYRGVRQTDSSSLLRLATAFMFLGFGFLVEALAGLGPLAPSISVAATAVVVGGLLLETTGYFFLAFSHAVDVMLSKRLGAAALLMFPIITVSNAQLTDVLSILSFYFVLYGVVETLYSYNRTRRPDTLLIALGLAMIGAGTFVQWLSFFYPSVDVLSQVLLLLQVIMKEIGLLILFTPVLNFGIRGVKIDGPV
ncbi:MAG TPA: hypothetical protein VEB67_01525 [Nitrososphaerales archaeon]|nr:hypothetical protein [Nitrososphaerales archaeon]